MTPKSGRRRPRRKENTKSDKRQKSLMGSIFSDIKWKNCSPLNGNRMETTREKGRGGGEIKK